MIIKIFSMIGIVVNTLTLHHAMLADNEIYLFLGVLLMVICVYINLCGDK